jgi:hypothetical protein
VYRGKFEAGVPQGTGEFTAADGRVVNGRWEQGKLVEVRPY